VLDLNKRNTFLDILTIMTVIVILCVFLLPLYWMFATSLREKGKVFSDMSFFPKNPSLYNYIACFTEAPLLVWIKNSFIVSLLTTIISVITSVFCGYSLSRSKYFEVKATGYFMLIARMLPAVFLIIPFYVLFARMGIIRSYLSLTISYLSYILPFGTWMMKGYFDSIPIQIDEAAEVDGSSQLRTLLSVLMPIAKPGIVATATYSMIMSWSDFIFSFTFMQGAANYTATVGVTSFIGEYRVEWGTLMAGSLAAILPVMIIFFILQRYLIEGMIAGSIKQ
jgi:multiple sugar transport system permease protein